MENNQEVLEETQGVGSKKVTDLPTIEKWLDEDIRRCLSLLTAISQDKDLRRQMATWFKGRIENFENRPDPSQTDLFPKR